MINMKEINISNTSAYDVPVLFLVFNQPEITNKVFQQIKKIKPKKLFVSADGPRNEKPGEIIECLEVRSLFNEIDWDCELQTRFLDTNLGCKKAVSTAISWFFEHNEEGIIIEYDCLPNKDFFIFCKIMLNLYRNDTRVMCISGNNFQDNIKRGDGSYYYSRIATIWGWATWRRAWRYWEGSVSTFPEFTQQRILKNAFNDIKSINHWHGKFSDVYNGLNISTWGFPWVYAVMSQGGLCVTPNVNLVTNIGFTSHATHATDKNSPFAFLATSPLTELKSPKFMVANVDADIYFSRKLALTPLSEKLRLFALKIISLILPVFFIELFRKFKRIKIK